MSAPRVSVVIVSRGRPHELSLCLTALRQLTYSDFEVVVVADGKSAVSVARYSGKVKLVAFEPPNISAARNAGIAQAAGEIVAFIDDDAVPEPTWLDYLVEPFEDGRVAVSGGFVRGKNGISYQWKARRAYPDGRAVPFDLETSKPTVFDPIPGETVKTEGTNMAVRKSVLVELGGFDAAFSFFLDETDLNMRISKAGYRTALAPLAQVVHGMAPSERRTSDRIPRDLRQIGSSLAIFQRKHEAHVMPVGVRREQRNRVVRCMRDGRMMPGDVLRLMRGFDAGYAEGQDRKLDQLAEFEAAPPFVQFRSTPPPSKVRTITARFWQERDAREEARASVEAGAITTLYLWSFSTLWHRLTFDKAGYWIQRGGQFGRSDRSDRIFKFWKASDRTRREAERWAPVRDPKKPQD